MLTIYAPAKINWFLNVLHLREDGFHEIQSLIQKVTLYDEISFAPSRDLVLETEAEILLEENLIFKAARRLQDAYGVETGAKIVLKKNIPMGAGLGGGSSDAAAALTGLNELWALKRSTAELSRIAEQLGSDVPFFLHGPLSYAHGRGEILSPCKGEKSLNILLVKPSFNISTAWAYRTLADVRSGKREEGFDREDPELTKKAVKVNNIRHFIRIFEKAELRGLNGVVLNDLESIVIKTFPVIAEIKDKLTGLGAEFSLMSGSGSTVFGVFNTRKEAEQASQRFKGIWTAVVETTI